MQVVTFTCKTLQKGILWMIILTGEINHRPAKDLVRRISLQSALLDDGHFTAWLLVSINLSYTSIALYTHLHHKISDIKFYKKECSLRRLLPMFSLTCYSFWHRVCFYVLFLLEYVYFFVRMGAFMVLHCSPKMERLHIFLSRVILSPPL